MKATIIYILVFAMLFIAVSGLIVFLNEKYENIFAFDFTPTGSKIAEAEEQTDPVKEEPAEDIPAEADSISQSDSADSVKVEESKPETETKPIPEELQTASVEKKDDTNKTEIQPAENIAEQTAAEPFDSSYHKWKKATLKFYEAMDSKKVAKIIQKYSDDIARDLLYSMKKKKAVEILSQLSDETVLRYTKAR